jgi:membrane protease YdiL (CAAX protease family)
MPAPAARRLLLAGECLAIAAASVVGAAAAALVVRSTVPVPANTRSLLSAILFLGGTALVLRGPARTACALRRSSAWLATLAGAAGLYLGAAVLLGVARPGLLAVGGTLFVLAAAEEAVFRGMLPRRLTGLARMGWGRRSAVTVVAAPLLAQVAFAASHILVAAPNVPENAHVEGTRLLAGGLLYFILAARYGLWISIGVHAALNTHLLYGMDFAYRAIPFGELVLTVAAALVVISRAGPRRPRRCDDRAPARHRRTRTHWRHPVNSG